MGKGTKTVVITGAGSGIGFAVASAFVEEGSNVVLNGRNEDKLTRAAAKLGQPGQLAAGFAGITSTQISPVASAIPLMR